MNVKYKRFVAVFINALLIFFLALFRYSGVASFRLGAAVPITLLPLIIAISMYFGDPKSYRYCFADILLYQIFNFLRLQRSFGKLRLFRALLYSFGGLHRRVYNSFLFFGKEIIRFINYFQEI